MSTIEGLEVYGGQFDVAVDDTSDEATTKSEASSKSKGDAKSKSKSTNDNKKGKKRKSDDEVPGVSTSGEGEGAGNAKRAKKALKKLAWKKKQMEQRAKRLEKKKQGSSK